MDHTSEACGWHRHKRLHYSFIFISLLLIITDSFMYHHTDTLHTTYYIVQNTCWYSIGNGKINNNSCIWHTEKSMHKNHSNISHLMLPRTNDLTHISSVFVLYLNNWLSNWEASLSNKRAACEPYADQLVDSLQSAQWSFSVFRCALSATQVVCSDVSHKRG